MFYSPVQIVVVDDDQEDFFVIRDFLKEIYGNICDVQWVNNSSAAIETIKSQTADVYLIDYQLDEKTGIDVLEELGKLGLTKPMILITGYSDTKIDLAAMEKGASDFLAKNELTSKLLERSIRYCLKRAEDQRNLKIAERFRADTEAVEKSYLAKSRFLANISHEIRTPLSSILGFAEIALEEDKTPKEKNHFLSIIKRSGDHLLDLINDFLDLSKMESPEQQIVKKEFNWRTVIDQVVELMSPRAKAKGVDLKVRFDDSISENLKNDPHRFRQILINLIGNAIKFTDQGQVTIECRLNENESNLKLSVLDTGIGISPQDQATLFQPFRQGNSNVMQKYGGTGLGLDLSRKLARAMDGDLILTESKPGGGSTFTLTLPCLNEKLRSPSTEQKKILLVEDSTESQFIIKHILEKSGYEVDIAKNGREGVEKALSDDYGAVLMDLEMPEMNGREAVKYLRDQKYLKPIIAISAHAVPGNCESTLQTEFTDCVPKPINRERLLATLNKLIA